MRTRLLLVTLSTCLAAGPALAAGKASKEETIGVGVGATVGALAGGPVGFIIGAALGAKLGDEFHEKGEQVEVLTGSLEASQARVAALEVDVGTLNADIDALTADLERMRSMARPELTALLASGIEMDLLFRTDEHVLTDSTRARIAELAATLAAMPDVRVRLDGYADARGDENYNQALSLKRAEHVRDLLTDNGVPGERIRVAGHGERSAPAASADDYAFERKVAVTLYVEDGPELAANPD
jgi:outer membrane protein OmpA-like peptidoglycan-associated protein